MGKTKEEALEFVGKEMPKGGVDNVASNVLKPITRKVAGDFPLIGSRITDPTQTGQFGKYNIQALDTMDRYPLIRQSIDDQKLNWQKTLEFIKQEKLSLKKTIFEPRVKFIKKINLIKKLCSKFFFTELMKLNKEYQNNLYKLKLDK